MLILPAEADEALVGTAVDRIAKVVSAAGGQVGKIDRWGRRRFAYEIAHQTEGYYVVVRFTAEPTTAAELERPLNLGSRFDLIAGVPPGVRQGGMGQRVVRIGSDGLD